MVSITLANQTGSKTVGIQSAWQVKELRSAVGASVSLRWQPDASYVAGKRWQTVRLLLLYSWHDGPTPLAGSVVLAGSSGWMLACCRSSD